MRLAGWLVGYAVHCMDVRCFAAVLSGGACTALTAVCPVTGWVGTRSPCPPHVQLQCLFIECCWLTPKPTQAHTLVAATALGRELEHSQTSDARRSGSTSLCVHLDRSLSSTTHEQQVELHFGNLARPDKTQTCRRRPTPAADTDLHIEQINNSTQQQVRHTSTD